MGTRRLHEPQQLDAGIDLLPADGRRLRISWGIDEVTMRTVAHLLRKHII